MKSHQFIFVVFLIAFLISSIYCARSKTKFKANGYTNSRRQQSNVCFWNQTSSWSLPYQSVTVECCDLELKNLMSNAINVAQKTPKLGDLAKYIQRRAQLHYQVSFEVFISSRNFAISSHYHGTHSCKIFDGNRYYLIYETPRKYNPFDMKVEDYLATIDSSDPLGSSKIENSRGDFMDIRQDPTAGEDLSIQPEVDLILQYPNKFAKHDPKEDIVRKFEEAEKRAKLEMEKLMESLTDMTIQALESNVTVAGKEVFANSTLNGNVTEIELPNPSPIPRNFANLRKQDSLPENTHCDKKKRDGNICCDGRLASTMRDAMMQMATSPDFGHGTESIIASVIQQKVQRRFEKSFEVLVSQDDFVIRSSYIGDNICKFQNRGFFIAAYATPRQYDVEEKQKEAKFATTMNGEPLGSNKTSFDNQASWHTELKLYPSGDRAGYPVGSHCAETRTGSKCCSLIMFNAMNSAYNKHINNADFDPYEMRKIASEVQWNVEEVFQYSAEVIVSFDDFVYATHLDNNYTCKYRVDKYYILAYLTPTQPRDDREEKEYNEKITEIGNEPDAEIVQPVFTETKYSHQLQVQSQQIQQQIQQVPAPIVMQYYNPLSYQQFQPMFHQPWYQNSFARVKRQIGESPYPPHTPSYNDIGSAKPFNCPAGLGGLSGLACCDGGLQFEANKVIDQAKQSPNFDKHNTRDLAKLMTRAVQKRFGTTFESVIAEADFSWGTNKFNQNTCKIDNNGYSALTYQSSTKSPPASDFIDIPNDPTLGGPTGSGGGGGGDSSASAAAGGSANGGGAGNGEGAGNGAAGNGGAANGGAANGGAANGGAANGGAANGGAANGGAANGGAANGGAANAAGDVGASALGNGANDLGASAFANNDLGAAALANSDLGAAGLASQNDLGWLGWAAGAGAGAGACFSLDTWVTTPTGKKRMDDLDIGDYVLTASQKSTFFAPIILWIHREPETLHQFITIMTTYGKTLRMTRKHFIFRNKCGEKFDRYIDTLPADGEAVFADQLKVDDCVVVLTRGRFEQQKIQEIFTVVRKGIYSPLTSNGRIIVNDMLASCYSEVQQSTLQTTFFWAADKFRRNILEAFGNLTHGKIEIPNLTSLSKDILQLVVPIRK
ncbi:unnamed protein product [Caenorhabditis angaria]|uniref:Ground-like domain-containing protein n=1 Tax=Caenorhabditis angaria TaxID=860376 RepID=A0A9P1NBK9_9PELO|nr:unnamed protein product [Caenorhabditis angaria]